MDCGSGLAFNGQWMLRVREPEPHSNRWRLSAKFFSSSGHVACEICDNEIILPAANFDIEQTARTFIVRGGKNVVLEFECIPPSEIAIKQYTLPTSGGTIFIGCRKSIGPFASDIPFQNVIEFRHNSGAIHTFANCTFRADTRLDLRMEGDSLVMNAD